MKKTDRIKAANEKLERAAKEADKNTRPGREAAARLITQANAIKAGRPIPSYAKAK